MVPRAARIKPFLPILEAESATSTHAPAGGDGERRLDGGRGGRLEFL